MAKAKKTQATPEAKPAGGPKPRRTANGASKAQKATTKVSTAARQPGAKPAVNKPLRTAPAPMMPLIDTSLAAEAAAKMVANRDPHAKPEAPEKREGSSLIKQLKQSLHKPMPQGPGGLLSNLHPGKKPNLPFGGRNQVGHNQTFGADVNRSGVPRRTGG